MERKDVVNSIREIGSEIPNKYDLGQNYPNPFNPTTIINFSIPESGLVTLKVFNVLGQEVVTLVNEVKSAGTYEVDFDASQLTTGMYVYTISSGNYSATKKMMLVK
ncbi:MAG: T9SS type A sorting domain-containing protein [Melioribacteraceae bacterium]|nr:T9SS type A sorting domain-containing protein [Melioribacteraceae bacterium]